MMTGLGAILKKNIGTSLVLFIVSSVLSIIGRKYFLEYLGAEFMGVIATLSGVIGLLGVFELGIVSVIRHALYEPITKGKHTQVSAVLGVQYSLYQRITVPCLVVALSLSLVAIPYYFADVGVPTIVVMATMAVLGVAQLLYYRFSFVNIVLSVDLKEYISRLFGAGFAVGKFGVHMASFGLLAYVGMSTNSYVISWLVIELVSAVLLNLAIYRYVRTHYPYVSLKQTTLPRIWQQYPAITTGIKNIISHKCAGVVLGYSSPIVVFHYLGATQVFVYDSYMAIAMAVNAIFVTVWATVENLIGRLVVDRPTQQVIQMLYAYTTVRYALAFGFCFVLYSNSDYFIALWIGKQYVLDKMTLAALSLCVFLILARSIDGFIQAYGLYADKKAPLVELALNLVLSAALGCYWGMKGVLLGVAVSLVVLVYIWKPYFLYRQILGKGVLSFWLKNAEIVGCLVLSAVVSTWLVSANQTSMVGWFLSCVAMVGVQMMLFGLMMALNPQNRAMIGSVKQCLQL